MPEIKDGTYLPVPPHATDVTVVSVHHEDARSAPGTVQPGYYVEYPDSELGRYHLHYITDDREAAIALSDDRSSGFYGLSGRVCEYPVVYGEGGMLYLHTPKVVMHEVNFKDLKTLTADFRSQRENNLKRAQALARLTSEERALLGI